MRAVADAGTWPAGLRLMLDVVDPSTESELVALIEASGLAYPPYDHGNRRASASYGLKYDYAADAFRQCAPMPAPLLRLREAAASLAGVRPGDMPECLLNRYEPGAVIQPHVDKPEWEHVVGISLGTEAPMQFSRGDERIEVMLPARSMYLLGGDARYVWRHALPPVSGTRYSITYRSLSAAGQRLHGAVDV